MLLPLTFWDYGLWVAITAIILLITAEMTSPYYGRLNILINKKRLKSVALGSSFIFLFFVAVRVLEILIIG
jgi:hypothetical protein